METENKVNVEAIMDEIRADIKTKGYVSDMLSFDDVVIDASSINVVKFDQVKFNEDLFDMNHEWEVQAYRPLSGNKITVFFKKVIRKFVYFFVEPIVIAQDGFNASVVRSMNQLNCYIKEKDDEIAELKKEIENLKNQQR